MANLSLASARHVFTADRPKEKFAELRGYRAIALELDRHFADPVAVTNQHTLPFGTKWALTLVARVIPIS